MDRSAQDRRTFLKALGTAVSAVPIAGCIGDSTEIVLEESFSELDGPVIEHTFSVDETGVLTRNEEESERIGPEILFNLETGGNVNPLANAPFGSDVNLFPSTHDYVSPDTEYKYVAVVVRDLEGGANGQISLEFEPEDRNENESSISPDEALERDREPIEDYVEAWKDDDRGYADPIPRIAYLLQAKASSFQSANEEVRNYAEGLIADSIKWCARERAEIWIGEETGTIREGIGSAIETYLDQSLDQMPPEVARQIDIDAIPEVVGDIDVEALPLNLGEASLDRPSGTRLMEIEDGRSTVSYEQGYVPLELTETVEIGAGISLSATLFEIGVGIPRTVPFHERRGGRPDFDRVFNLYMGSDFEVGFET